MKLWGPKKRNHIAVDTSAMRLLAFIIQLCNSNTQECKRSLKIAIILALTSVRDNASFQPTCLWGKETSACDTKANKKDVSKLTEQNSLAFFWSMTHDF